jgi:Tfp pilus assembly PilM family ATPase
MLYLHQGDFMVAVKGIYQGGDTVKLDSLSVHFTEPYEVVVAFLNPIQKTDKTETSNKKRQDAFERFMQYGGTLSADFDYKKELNDYREERYGHIN